MAVVWCLLRMVKLCSREGALQPRLCCLTLGPLRHKQLLAAGEQPVQGASWVPGPKWDHRT